MVLQASGKGSERPHLVSGQEERRARLLHPAAVEAAGLAGRAAAVSAVAPRRGRPDWVLGVKSGLTLQTELMRPPVGLAPYPSQDRGASLP